MKVFSDMLYRHVLAIGASNFGLELAIYSIDSHFYIVAFSVNFFKTGGRALP